jgi:hypothetical protein
MAKKQRNKKQFKRPQIAAWLWISFLTVAIISFICASFLIGRWLLNAFYVATARLGKPQPAVEMVLMGLNFPDGYVVNYNIGNYALSHGYYKTAEDAYYRAVANGIPYGKECPVKVNMALALIYQISDSQWESFLNAETVDDLDHDGRIVQETLLTAKSYLTEEGCAHEEDEDGHYEQAQILKDEIDELLKKDSSGEGEDDGESDSDSSNDDKNEDEGGNSQNNSDSAREDKIKESIQNQKEKNQKERSEDRQYYENNYGLSEDDFKGEGGGGGSDNNDSDEEGGGSPGNGENDQEDEWKIW